MPSAAYPDVVSIGGTSTALTDEATTRNVANTVYQITDATKRVLDPAVAVVVQVDTGGGFVTAAASSYDLDRLFGIVTFHSDQGGSAVVRIHSGNYIPILDALEIRSFKHHCKRTVLDATVFPNAFKSKKLGLKDIDGSFEALSLLTDDQDPGGATTTFAGLFDGATPVLYQVKRGSKAFRAWVLLEQLETDGNPDSLIGNTINFTGSARGAGAAYGWES